MNSNALLLLLAIFIVVASVLIAHLRIRIKSEARGHALRRELFAKQLRQEDIAASQAAKNPVDVDTP